MPQTSQPTSQLVIGPVNQGGDILHVLNASNGIQSWTDKNNMIEGLSGVNNSIGTNAPVTGAAAAATVFTPILNLPGNSSYEGVPFTVKAAGWLTLNGGTYTATVQPLIYASTSLGFTASAAAAVLSTTAISLTIAVAAAATLTTYPWEAELTLVGSTATGIVGGRSVASVGPPNGTGAAPTPLLATSTNTPVSIAFAGAVPMQFLAGVTTVGAAISAEVVTLTALFLES